MRYLDWIIIDGIGPFFRGYDRKRVNWSKIPFDHVESSGMLSGVGWEQLVNDFQGFLECAVAAGYNSIVLDDLAHLIDWGGYPDDLRIKLGQYRQLYQRLFKMAEAKGLRVLVTSDVIFYCPALEKEFGSGIARMTRWLSERLGELFRDFPQVAGVIFRIGESDAIGVQGDFLSRLTLKTPHQTREFISAILPIFEENDRVMIFRTWTVGTHPIGDLIWHRQTFQKVFDGFSGRHLIISMKYGESDFFRYLPLNAHFFRTSLPLIVEFQTRREYEGFGEYPSFTGWEYENYLKQLSQIPNLVGASIWCQTGGWGRFRRLTYIQDSSVWVEMNTFVTAGLCRGLSCEVALRHYAAHQWPGVDAEALLAFLSLSDDVIRELLYVRAFAQQKLFFRRLRVPPLLFVYWDRIFMTPLIGRALRVMVDNHQECVREGYEALRKLDQMREMAAKFHLPDQGLDFQRDTFEILAVLRESIFSPEPAQFAPRLRELKKAYRRKWKPLCYSVKLKAVIPTDGALSLRWALRLLLRGQRGYRRFDSIVTLRLLSVIYPLLAPWRKRVLPKFVHKQAMGIDSIFR